MEKYWKLSIFLILIPTPDFPHFYYMLGGNLGSLLYGDVSVMSWRIVDAVKDKKRKKDQNKNNKSKKIRKENKRLSPSWDSNHDRLRGKQGSYPLD